MRELFFIFSLLQVGNSLDSDLTLVEEETPPVFVGNVANLTDIKFLSNSDELNALRYTIISRSDKLDQMFKLDEISGDLSTTQSIDREEMCSHLPKCVLKLNLAVQSLTSAFFRRFLVDIKIVDINDNDPEFKDEIFQLNVREDTQIGSLFLLPTATDRDGESHSKPISYHISETNFPFELSLQNNVPCLILVSEMDRETTGLYTSTLIASDGLDPARSATLSISITVKDANDNAPVFHQKAYESRIPETTNMNTTILQVSASDIDLQENGRIKYFLAKQNSPAERYFQVESVSGGIYVQDYLRSEGGSTFVLQVVASDSGHPSLSTSVNVTVYITDTEDDAPTINIQLLFSQDGVAAVEESSPLGRVVALLSVEDDDSGYNGETICTLENIYFQLQKLQPKEYKVFVRRTLNREVLSRHNVIINCQDFGNPPMKSTSSFTVTVEDENDSTPVFDSKIYAFNVQENGTLPAYIGHVTAFDRDEGINGDIKYEIVIADLGYEFSINNTGHIFAISSLDYERTSQLVFSVLALDRGEHPLTATAAVFVNITDKNDNHPVFGKSIYTFRILENEPVRFSLGCVSATDEDSGENGNLTFTALTHENMGAMPFDVSSFGCIKLVEKLDYENIKSYEFQIVAADNGNPVLKTTAFVVVSVLDENDNKPVIIFPVQTNDTIIISHNTVPRSEIAVVQAYDTDSKENGRLLFTLSSQNGSDLFDIDTSTGHISTTREIDKDEIQSYTLRILVSDFGTPKLQTNATLIVDVQEIATQEPELLNRFKNLKIVSVLVCVTIVLSLAVMTIVCLIKYMDKRKRQVQITKPQNTNIRHVRDFNEIAPIPASNNVYICEKTRYIRHNTPHTTETSGGIPADTSTVSRQNRHNDVIMSSRDHAINRRPRQDKRVMKIYRRNKHTPQIDENSSYSRSENDISLDLDASVLDILKRHNQVVRSVKASKSQKRQLATDLFNIDPWSVTARDALGSDSGIGGSDIEMKIHPVYTIPV